MCVLSLKVVNRVYAEVTLHTISHHTQHSTDTIQMHTRQRCCGVFWSLAIMEGLYLHEPNGKGYYTSVELEGVVASDQSDFQKMEVVDTVIWGRMLVLDGQVQSAARDEHHYHEMLVQPSMLAHPNPKRVFIGGGGEGATAREILRHKSVEEVVMVDIDEKVTDLCKAHLPQWHQGAFDDPRFTLINKDAKAELEKYEDGYFDVIVLDLADPLDCGACFFLYTTEFYQLIFDKLSPQGVMVTQSGPANHYDLNEVWAPVHNTLLNTNFTHVYPYRAEVPSFTGMWAFTMACKGGEQQEEGKEGSLPTQQLSTLGTAVVDKVIEGRLGDTLKHYDGCTHLHSFMLPKNIRKLMEEETRVISEATPIYVSYTKAAPQANNLKPVETEAKASE